MNSTELNGKHFNMYSRGKPVYCMLPEHASQNDDMRMLQEHLYLLQLCCFSSLLDFKILEYEGRILHIFTTNR